MVVMEQRHEFDIERTTPMNILGHIMTGSISGIIIVSVLLFIGILFLSNQNFSPISIIYFSIFILPMGFIIYNRLVKRGKKLMGDICFVVISLENDIKKLKFKSGFPNTMNPNWQILSIDDKNRDLEIKGDDLGGYYIKLNNNDNQNEDIRLGLWIDLIDAEENAKKLQKDLGGNLQINVN